MMKLVHELMKLMINELNSDDEEYVLLSADDKVLKFVDIIKTR